jgi:NAD(P)H-flavin reductase
LTKRFGVIAASQLPVQYVMGLKKLNPFIYVFKSSHEQLNRFHRALGRVVYLLLSLHFIFYINYFIQHGILGKRLTQFVVLAGVLAFTGLNLMTGTALRAIRRYSYRIFFVTHIIAALAIPPLLFFHASSARLFFVEAFAVLIADLVFRKMDTVTSQATLESIPGTNLVKVSASIPYHKINRFRANPGSHIYLSIPTAARPSSTPTSSDFILFEFLFNPFTVASVHDETGELTLVARHRSGPMTAALARFAGMGPPVNSLSHSNILSWEEGKIPLSIEGPYGIVKYFPNLAGGKFARVLLVAGGVGATFTVPIYRSILHDNPNAKVEMVWALRGAGDATWAVTETEGGKSILDDENVHIFLTGDILENGNGAASSSAPRGRTRGRTGSSSVLEDNPPVMADDGEVEMTSMYRDRKRNRYTSHHNRKRPDLKKIVDDVFMHGIDERIAVLVCGPDEMASELRDHVGAWVMKGRSVWWHNESFGL